MKAANSLNHSINFCKLHSEDKFDDLRYAGKILGQALLNLEKLVKSKTTASLKELDSITEEFFEKKSCKPVFKGYHGFPSTVCISVNKTLVHGIPTDYKLQDGDLVSFDTGCSYNGAITDSAITCIYGTPKNQEQINLIYSTKLCLYNAIRSIKSGSKLGIIGHTIYNTARQNGFKVIEQYSGHGISDQVHSDPIISNRSEIDVGIRLQPGMVIAIEPLLIPNTSSTKTTINENGWDVECENDCAHTEHSLLITKEGLEILTLRENEMIKI